jgi:hypothetical protein
MTNEREWRSEVIDRGKKHPRRPVRIRLLYGEPDEETGQQDGAQFDLTVLAAVRLREQLTAWMEK